MATIEIRNCRHCAKLSNDLTWCSCKRVKYCSDQCKKIDRNRHSKHECVPTTPITIPEEYNRILQLLLDTTTDMGDRVGTFLHVKATRDTGNLFVVPLVSQEVGSIRSKFDVSPELDAVILTWSPVNKQEVQISSFMYVLDEKDWKRSVLLSFGIHKTPTDQTRMRFELEMERLGFLSGTISALITSNGGLSRVATKDVFIA